MKILLLLLFWGLWYLNFSSRTVLSPLLPLIEDTLSINHAMAGSLFLAFYIGNTTALFSAGPISLRIGYKRSILISFCVMIASYMALRFAATYHQFMAFTFILGISAGFYLPCAMPLITASFKQEHWGKAISIHETAAGFSILTIPFLVVLALRWFQWQTIFVGIAFASLIMTILLMSFSPDPRTIKEQTARLSQVLRRKSFWIITILWISCATASIGVYNIIPLYLVKERGLSVDVANTLFGVSRVGGFIAMVLVGFILDRFKVRYMLFALLLATGIATMGVAIIHVYWLLVVMLFAQATFSVVFFPVGLVAIAKMTSLSERSTFTGALMGISSIIGPGLSPVILGAVADRWNFQIGILIVGILITATSLLYKQLQDI